MSPDKIHDANELLKATPPVAYQSLVFAGVPLSDWVTILTVIYLLFQLAPLVIKYYKVAKEFLCKSKPDLPPSE